MFQREFALRLVAKPGDELYCRLSVNAQLLSRIEHVVKVGRNNFIPPPKVESSVVRITPIPCSLDFDEWDGMMRILFVRKNKTVRSGFGNKILSMLEGNYKTMCSVRGEDVPMDFDIKQLVEGVLEKTQMGDKRPAKMAKDDFLALLMGFIEAGIRFSNK
jgi:18S rRNA (adenine1779-N6/adenine1780-N6)-dimethyltransferase